MKRTTIFLTVFVTALSILAQISYARGTVKIDENEPMLYTKKQILPGNIDVEFSIVSLPKYTKEVNDVFSYSFGEISKIAETFSDGENPNSEIAKVNAAAGKEPVKVSPETLSLAKHAKEISEWSRRAYDPIRGNGNSKQLKINERDSTIFLKKPGLTLELGGILEGFMADLFIRAAHAAGIEHAFVRVNGVSRAMGRATYGPWYVQITGEGQSRAKHGRRIIISNYSSATVGGEAPPPLTDPRTGNPVDSPFYSVTVVTTEAATAQGVADSVYVMGESAGKQLIDSLGIRAILAYKDGSMKQIGHWPSSKK